jgi:hypothetical protein
MTDEEEARVREIIDREVQALVLKVAFKHGYGDKAFSSDMHWHYPRAYKRISDEVLAKYNITPKKLDQLRQRRNLTGEDDEPG